MKSVVNILKETLVPDISRFFGIIITMYFSDHQPPHFHVRYGNLPPRVFGLVAKWAWVHRDELQDNWKFVQNETLPNKIDPLE